MKDEKPLRETPKVCSEPNLFKISQLVSTLLLVVVFNYSQLYCGAHLVYFNYI